MARLNTRAASSKEQLVLDDRPQISDPRSAAGGLLEKISESKQMRDIDRDSLTETRSKSTRKQKSDDKSESDNGPGQASIRQEASNDSDSMLSSLAALRLQPSDQETGPVARRSPRKPAPRRRPFWHNDSMTIDAESATENGSTNDDEDDSALSDFLVNDSASETELRKPPPSSTRNKQIQQKSRRRLVQKSSPNKIAPVHEDSDDDDEVRVSKSTDKSHGVVALTKPSSQALESSSDKENDTLVLKPRKLDFTDKLDATVRFSPPGRHNVRGDGEATPPMSPSRPRLQSPTRNRVIIPKLPHRQSIDAFWDQGAVDQWNDVHSPKKTPAPAGRLLPLLLSPSKPRALQGFSESDSESSGYESPSVQSPSKAQMKSPSKPTKGRDRAAIEAKKNFENEKHSIASRFLAELDSTITKGEIARLSASTGGVKLEWNKKLNSTAGRAKWKREKTRAGKPASSTSPSGGPLETKNTSDVSNGPDRTSASSYAPASVTVHHHASIELADKVIDDEDRLLNVLAHEFCHLANFMVSGIKDNPHGREFKAWAAKVSHAFAGRGINVTTKHSYAIAYKYIWACTTCATEYKRHSKSVDTSKHVCSACKGSLLQIQPAPRNPAARQKPVKTTATTATGNGEAVTTGGAPDGVGYNAFVKANFALVRVELQSLGEQRGHALSSAPSLGEVNAELAKRWRALKSKGAKSKAAALMELQSVDSDDDTAAAEPAHPPSSPGTIATGVKLVTDNLGAMLLGPAA